MGGFGAKKTFCGHGGPKKRSAARFLVRAPPQKHLAPHFFAANLRKRVAKPRPEDYTVRGPKGKFEFTGGNNSVDTVGRSTGFCDDPHLCRFAAAGNAPALVSPLISF